MYSLKNDYSEGAHPKILEALMESNFVQEEGYGYDKHTQNAISRIKELSENENIDIHLISGGTQTNLIAIDGFLRPYEACISPNTGHIAVNECGAIEYTGHKVITIDCEDGKLNSELIDDLLGEYGSEHLLIPKLVYISNPTELGTVYTKDELKNLYDFCQKKNLLLYVDGARLGSALCLEEANLSLADMCKYTDAFSIGGTKNGALLGEALVISNESLQPNFRHNIKQKGALLAKGRLLGIQFEELFKDGLYFELASHSNKMGRILSEGIKECGYDLLIESPTNQVFPILPNKIIEELEKDYLFYRWTKVDENTSSIRLITAWATKEEAISDFVKKLKELSL
ncbi:threonine aldolase family protein [Clostridium sp. B9]|uniref:threonine aldolase family protein n=1 Tax=Clostridium sp. B9 TaxID=3423224 RepID=UPI003D2EFDAA